MKRVNDLEQELRAIRAIARTAQAHAKSQLVYDRLLHIQDRIKALLPAVGVLLSLPMVT